MLGIFKTIGRLVGKVPNGILGTVGTVLGGGGVVAALASLGGATTEAAAAGVTPECMAQIETAVGSIVVAMIGAGIAGLGLGGAGQRVADKG